MSSQVVNNYRFLLKHIKALPSAQNWRCHIIAKFKAGRAETDASKVEHLRASATQYVTMIRSINELKFLRGLDTGEKLGARDKIRATAGRVGLSVPRFADDAFEVPLQELDEKKLNRKI